MFTKEEASELANQHALKNGYLSVELLKENYNGPEVVGPSYLFSITENEPEDTKLVGLPLRIVVDQLTGNVFETRIL